jgi:hypothetical protein
LILLEMRSSQSRWRNGDEKKSGERERERERN